MGDLTASSLARDIEILVELFKSGDWAELRVEHEMLGLLLSTDRTTPALGGQAVDLGATAAWETTAAPSIAAAVAAPGAAPPPDVATSLACATALDPSWASVVAPNLGTFYRAPKPGAPPFEEVGDQVGDATEVCLVEVMKLFTSVRAGISGTVRHIAVGDGELVEGGQALIFIERE